MANEERCWCPRGAGGAPGSRGGAVMEGGWVCCGYRYVSLGCQGVLPDEYSEFDGKFWE